MLFRTVFENILSTEDILHHSNKPLSIYCLPEHIHGLPDIWFGMLDNIQLELGHSHVLWSLLVELLWVYP